MRIVSVIFKRDGFFVLLKRIFKFIRNNFKKKSQVLKSQTIIDMVKQERWPQSIPLVSIIIPCYNYGNFVKEALESAINQTFKNIEIVIINDGSTDKNTVDVLNTLNYPRTIVIHQANQGLARTRNNGAKVARGKYVCYLDADDIMDPTYIEKALLKLEADENLGCVYSWLQCFGDNDSIWKTQDLDVFLMRDENVASSHSVIRKEAWQSVVKLNGEGFLSQYNGFFEDWVFWIDMVRSGFGGIAIKETLIKYRIHKNSLSAIHKSGFNKKLLDLKNDRKDFFKNDKVANEIQKNIHSQIKVLNPYLNIYGESNTEFEGNRQILILMPWLTFGGAETLVYNYCSRLKNDFNFSIITSLKSQNEWEYKFKEITGNIYHLPNLFQREEEYLEFMKNYIRSKKIDVIHIVHNSSFYEMLPEIKREFPRVKVISTVFNVIADHFSNSIECGDFIDVFTTDNTKVLNAYENQAKINNVKKVVICNGIDCSVKFNPATYDRSSERTKLNIKEDEFAVYFIGRLSPEKNPDVFVEAAKKVLANQSNVKFFVIGDGPMRMEIEKSINAFDNPNLAFLGYQIDIPRFLSTADIFVLPSSAEGFPLSNVEAMSMGVCVIASDVGGVSDAIKDGETGFLMQPNSSEELAEKIEFAISQKETLKNISKNARKSVEENFSIEVLAEKYKNLYKSVNE